MTHFHAITDRGADLMALLREQQGQPSYRNPARRTAFMMAQRIVAGLELEIAPRVIDAIQGHAGRTAGDNYGDVTLKARIGAIWKLPEYDLSGG